METTQSLSVTFARGARRVTGSNFLVEAKEGGTTTRILIDCGLAQGERFSESVNAEKFSYDPASVDAIFFTHAHADHIGLFPKLVKDGFRGTEYATAPTRALLAQMLEDSLHIAADEARRNHDAPPYSAEDVAHAVSLMRELPYHETVRVGSALSVTLYNAGHIIGSASAAIDAFGTRLLFTGDLGRSPAVIVPDREYPEKVDYLFMESVYGDRVHEPIAESVDMLRSVVEDTRRSGGVLLIPAFSLERTQIILSNLDQMFSKGGKPMPVFLDSPLAAKVTAVYEQYPEFLREDIRARMQKGDDPFSFPTLRVTKNVSESHEADQAPAPKIIIAGSGMSHGGRIMAHEARYLPERSTTILLTGYQAAGSLGRRIQDGAKEVTINGASVSVRAAVKTLGGFSAHADRDDLMSYVEAVKPKKVFVILGETQSSAFIAQRIQGFLGIPTDVPREGETLSL